MELTSQQLKDIKVIEVGILKEFINICDTLGLRYYLMGGTMLGAVRHKGFIPWDDDIDVGMPRGDYEIFLSKAQSMLPNNIFVQSFETDRDYMANFAKLRRSDTTFVEIAWKKRKINHGVYIDVFPLDYYPDDEDGRKKFSKKNRVYARRLFSEYDLKEKTIKYKLISFLLKIAYPSAESVLKKRDKLFREVSPSGMIANYCGAWGQKEIVPAEWYGEGTMLEFEGIQVCVPKEYDKWLTQVYGDYMQLPPEEKRIPRHTVAFVDLERSYTVYVNGDKK